MVIWLLGLSGSGKTTLGRKLQSYLEDISIPHYMIDGDDAKTIQCKNAKSALHYVLAL